MVTDLETWTYPGLYARFAGLFDGKKPWMKVVADLQLQIRANPYSQPQIERENRISYGLAAFDRIGLDGAGSAEWPDVAVAMGFVAQVLTIIDQAADEKGRKAYIGRIRGAFANPSEIRAIRFEHLTAVALFRQGARIDWPELMGGPDRFDILATDRHGTAVEVECKSCSPDKGRAITESEANQFFPHLIERLAPLTSADSAIMVKVRVPKRLPRSPESLGALADEIVQALKAGVSTTATGVQLESRQTSSPMVFLVREPDRITERFNSQVSQVFGHPEGHRALAFNPEKATAICVEVCSERTAGFFSATWDTVKHAVRKQMTKTRPGCLVLRVEGIGKEALEDFLQERPNTLALFAEKVFRDPQHQHLACLAYISDETMNETSPGSMTPQSCTYVLDRKEGPYAGLRIGHNLLGPYKDLHDS